MIVAVDAGASHVRAALAAGSGAILAQAVAGPANPYALGAAAADRERRRAILACLRSAGVRRNAVVAAVIGSAGVSPAGAAADVTRRTRRLLPAARVCVVADGEIAHAGALGGAAGIVIISGTGSIVWGCNARGAWARAGGWGWLLGDEGSGQWLGRQAYAAALRAQDGSGPPTRITRLLARHLGLRSPARLAAMAQPLTPAAFGAVAPLVLAAARERDPVARAIVAAGADALAAQAAAVARRLRLAQRRNGCRVSYQGSALTASPVLRRALRRALERRLPGAIFQAPAGTPLAGALRLARAIAPS